MNIPARLLIIDDEERIRQLMLDYLEDHDEFEVRLCGSAEEALDMLAREPADVCIVDTRLPGMDGLTFIETARRQTLCPRFMLHTGSVELARPPALAECGLPEDDVFLKPCDMERMVARMRALLWPDGETA